MSWTSIATRSIGLILILPLILKHYTTSEIVLWQLFSSIIGLQLLVDVGFNGNFSRLIAYAVGGAETLAAAQAGKASRPAASNGPNARLLSDISGTLILVYKRLALLLAIILGAIGTLAVVTPIDNLSPPAVTTKSEAWVAWIILVVSSAWNFRNNAYVSLLQGASQICELRRGETLVASLTFITNAALISNGSGILSLIGSTQAWQVVNWAINHYSVRRWFEGQHLPLPNPAIHDYVITSIWPNAWKAAAGALMSFGVTQGMSILYAQKKDSAEVASYLIATRIIQTISQTSQAPFYSKLPAMASQYAAGETIACLRLAARGMSFSFWSYTVPWVALAILGPTLLQVIGSSSEFPNHSLWSLLGLAVFAERFGAMQLQLFSISNTIVWHIANGVTGCLQIAFALGLYPAIGVFALPISILLPNILFLVPYTSRLVNMQFGANTARSAIRTAALPLVVILVTGTLLYNLNR